MREFLENKQINFITTENQNGETVEIDPDDIISAAAAALEDNEEFKRLLAVDQEKAVLMIRSQMIKEIRDRDLRFSDALKKY